MGNRIAKHVYLDNTFAELSLEKSTYYVRDASGNTMAVYEKTYDLVEEQTSYLLTERHIYGSSRLGMDTEHVEMLGPDPDTLHRRLGLKQYELSNHLGNVLSVITDIKLPVLEEGSTTNIISYSAVIISATDYSPFGVALYGRSWSSDSYRYGFNGKEKDSETTAGAYDFGARIYDGRLGRWLSVDPQFRKQTSWSTYKGFKDNPVIFSDPSGETEYLTIIIQDQHGHSMSYRIVASEDVMTDGKRYENHTTMFGEPWIVSQSTRWFDFETTKTYTIDDNGKLLSTPTQTKILYQNGIKDEDIFMIDNDKAGDTKDPDGFNNTDEQGGGFHFTTKSDTASPTKTKSKNGGDSKDLGVFLTAISAAMKELGALPDLKELLGPAESAQLISDITSEVQEMIEATKNTPTGPATNAQPQPGDSVNIEYLWTQQGPKQGCCTPGNDIHSSGSERGVIPKDTVGGVFKGDKTKSVKKIVPIKK